MEALEKPIDLDLPFLSSCTGIMVLGICIGLVCLMLNFSRLSRVCICNPLTGDFRLVPGIGDGCTYFEFSDEDEHMYLGFCLNGDKGYELFKILYEYFPDDDDDEHTMCLEGAVYSLTTNTWREFDVNWGDFEYLEDHSKSCYSNQAMPVFERGVFYWEATALETAYIVSFDVKKDVFDDYLAPSDCSDEEWMLCDLKREAAVVVHHDDSESFDIWVLDETKKSWVLKLQVEDLPDVTILGCVESGVLAVQGSKGKNGKILTLSLYNTNTGDLVSLPYINVERERGVFLYTESLVPVNGVDNLA